MRSTGALLAAAALGLALTVSPAFAQRGGGGGHGGGGFHGGGFHGGGYGRGYGGYGRGYGWYGRGWGYGPWAAYGGWYGYPYRYPYPYPYPYVYRPVPYYP